MEKKKNQKANLEKTRLLFLAIGLIGAFTLMSFAFNWESFKTIDISENTEVITDPVDIVPITNPEPPEPRPDENVTKKVITNEILLVENDKPVDTTVSYVAEPFEEPIFIPITEPKDTTYVYVKEMPEFPGGELALRRFVAANVEYPALARENGVQGTIYIRFEVTKNGTVGKIEILNRDSDALLQNAATDVIRMLPKFKPGMQNGEYVNVWYSIPISFKLK